MEFHFSHFQVWISMGRCVSRQLPLFCFLKYKIQNVWKRTWSYKHAFHGVWSRHQRSQNDHHCVRVRARASLMSSKIKARGVACNWTCTPTQSCLDTRTSQPVEQLCTECLITEPNPDMQQLTQQLMQQLTSCLHKETVPLWHHSSSFAGTKQGCTDAVKINFFQLNFRIRTQVSHIILKIFSLEL